MKLGLQHGDLANAGSTAEAADWCSFFNRSTTVTPTKPVPVYGNYDINLTCSML